MVVSFARGQRGEKRLREGREEEQQVESTGNHIPPPLGRSDHDRKRTANPSAGS